jgi:oligopeptide/dipeptide ABC transporter ATP-binding protein
MYAGQIIETGPTQQLIEQPRHPYTRGLIGLIPKLSDLDAPIHPIEGRVPELIGLGGVCRFYERCEFRKPMCRSDVPMSLVAADRQARCLRVDEIPSLKEISQ